MELNILLKKPLSKDLLIHVITEYLTSNISSLDLSNQINLDSDVIKILAHNINSSAIIFF